MDDCALCGGQTTFADSTVFTGFRLENRFRLLRREHLVNPVLYVEYGQISGADKILKEIEGHDRESNFADSNAGLRKEHKHELELKLLLSSNVKGWNVAVNPIVTKNLLPSEPWEFAYAVGVSRPLALKASSRVLACMTRRITLRRRLRGIFRRTGLCVFRVASV